MLAALLAAQKKMNVVLLEKRAERTPASRAIGITPPSLEILAPLGLDTWLIAAGVKVERSQAHSRTRCLGNLEFSGVNPAYPFILAIPQSDTESILEKEVVSNSRISFMRGFEVLSVREERGTVSVSGNKKDGSRFSFSGGFALACDGAKSAVRESLGIRYQGRMYADTFLMADFDDTTGWGSRARLYFTRRGSIESFPLPSCRRRYVLRTPEFIEPYTSGYLVSEIPLRSGLRMENAVMHWESAFRVGRYTAARFSSGRVFLCGDAAHSMSPIGGQNMNTGFADVELAVWLADLVRRNMTDTAKATRLYDKVRQRAARTAGYRAWWMMRLGTSGGFIWSLVRNAVVAVLLHTPLVRLVLPVFAMQSIPFKNLVSSLGVLEKELGI